MDYNRLFNFDDPITTTQLITLGKIAGVPHVVVGYDDDLPPNMY